MDKENTTSCDLTATEKENRERNRRQEKERMEKNTSVLNSFRIDRKPGSGDKRSRVSEKTPPKPQPKNRAEFGAGGPPSNKQDLSSFGGNKPKPTGKGDHGVIFLAQRRKEKDATDKKTPPPFSAVSPVRGSLPGGKIEKLSVTDYGMVVAKAAISKPDQYVRSFDEGRTWFDVDGLSAGGKKTVIKSNIGTVAISSDLGDGPGTLDILFDRIVHQLQLSRDTVGLKCLAVDFLPFGGALFTKDKTLYYSRINLAEKSSLLGPPSPIMNLGENIGNLVDVQFVRDWSSTFDVQSAIIKYGNPESVGATILPPVVRRLRDYHQNAYARPYVFLWTQRGLCIYDIIDNSVRAISLGSVIVGEIAGVPEQQPQGKIVFAGSDGHVYVSTNKGASWTASKPQGMTATPKLIRANSKYTVLLCDGAARTELYFHDNTTGNWRAINISGINNITDCYMGKVSEIYLGFGNGMFFIDLADGSSRPICRGNTGVFGGGGK